MRKISYLLIGAFAAFAQERAGILMSGSAGFVQDGVNIRVRYTSVAEPPLRRPADLKISGGVGTEKNVMHRVMNDAVSLQSFGYDLTATPGPGADQITVVISPPSSKFSYTPVPLPKYPPPQVVQDGDTIALDLLASPDGSRKIVDYLTISTYKEPAAAATTAPARDYTPDDGTVNFGLFDATILIDGATYDGQSGFTGKPGATLWVAPPRDGRYILSLVPHDGFDKAGAIRDNSITFQSSGHKFEIRTQSLILGTKGAWNLYVMHDPLWQARPGQEMHLSAGTDRLENLLPKQ
jgi:hypothetical protein